MNKALAGWPIPLEMLLLTGCLIALFTAALLRGDGPVVYAVDVHYGPGVVCPAPPAESVPPGFTVVGESCGVTR